MTAGVLCAVRGPHESDVVTGLEAAADVLAVTRRCADVVELLAAAAAGLGRLAVVSADLPSLDRDAVRTLQLHGVAVLALAAPGSPDADRTAALGVDATVLTPARGDDTRVGPLVTAAVLALLESGPGRDGARVAARDTAPDHVLGMGTTPDHPAPGRLVAVWGPTGAPGRTTVAVNLAAELASGGALLVDADTYGGTVAQVLGLLDEAPGLAAATRAAGTGTLDAATLARLAPAALPGLRVLTGISRPDRWPELAASSLEVVWGVARQVAAWTVVDCGFCLEQDEVLSYDTRAPSRNGATLSALEAADVVVVVGAGDPVGVQRLVRGLGELPAVRGRRIVVVNRVRASVTGPRPAEAVTRALARYAGVTDPLLVPDDAPALDAALLQGRVLREVEPTSPARRALAALASSVTATGEHPARATGRRAARLAGVR